MNLLDVKNLKVAFETYNGTVTAVHDTSFFLQKKEVLGIVGESGCGKSVTAHSLMGLLPSRSTQVTAEAFQLEHQNILNLSESQWRTIRGNQVAMIFQDPMTSLNPILSIRIQLEAAIANDASISQKQRYAKAIELLQQVGISSPEERLKQYAHEMSGGMRQRIMIAMALAGSPKLLIADEPTTALDVTTEAQILSVMRELLREKGTGMLFISHNLKVIAQMCDRVMVMYAGTKVEEGTVEDIFNRAKHPYTKGLLASLPQGKKRGELKAIGGQAPDLFHMPKGCAFHPRCPQAMQICATMTPSITLVNDTQEVACWLTEKEVLRT